MADAAPAQTDAELAHLARVVREGVGRLNWRMRAESDGDSPGPAVLAVLSRLIRAGTHTPKELAEAERIQPQSLTRILATLTERGLVSRTPDPADGRRYLIDITPAGIGVLREYTGSRERWLAGALERALTPTERQLLALAAELLVRVADA
ncbi:MarR family transcriptional regulator [Lentzea sp. NPDC004782]|jgi:DNA-binding MarR family transcriptional regulator|uniref:MarR family winged helix-turn-helix transcriptional regulator n=1 Tax=Lentzea sp. NPDC004782 TaxID=3154458 RepID=UPI0033BEE10D